MKILKKLAVFSLLLVISVSSTVFAQNDKLTVTLDGAPIAFDVEPQLINDTTMVPFRAIAEALGASVMWNDTDRSVLFTKADSVAMLQIDNPKLFLGSDDIVELETPPVIVSDRTMVPLRAISESFKISVDWNGETKTVSLATK